MNAVDPVDRLQCRIKSCVCDGDCSTCEILQVAVDEICRLKEALRKIEVLSHSEVHKHVYRGA